MFSVIIPTHDSEQTLVPTLAALVPGAAAGMVREVIIADAGSHDETRDIADVSGANLMMIPGSLGARLKKAAASARASWLMFLRPGMMLEPDWITDTTRFAQDVERAGASGTQAAIFRANPKPTSAHVPIIEAFVLLRAAFGAKPHPDQGLLIAKQFYDNLGGHSEQTNDCEIDLLRHLGRRRLVVLRCGVTQAGV